MTVLIKNTQNGMEHLISHVIAVTENAGHIELKFDDTYGMISGTKFPLGMYKVVKVKGDTK